MNLTGTKAWIAGTLLAGMFPGVAAAQSLTPTTDLFSAGRAQAGASSGSPVFAAFMVTAVAVGVFMGLAKLVDLFRAREMEKIALQGKISDAVFGNAVAPNVHVPLWAGSPVTIDMTGVVTSASQEQAILHRASSAAAEVRPDVAIRNRMILVEGPELRAA
jgi:hypothetical protein